MLVIVLAFATLSMTVMPVSGDTKGSMTIKSAYDDGRGTKELDVSINNIEGLHAGQFELHYNSDFGYIRDAELGSVLGDSITSLNMEQAKEGVISLSFASLKELPESGTLLDFEFYVQQSNDSTKTEFTLKEAALYNEEEEEISYNSSEGFIKPFQGESLPNQEVTSDKEWTVSFNTEMSGEIVNSSTVFVLNHRGDIVPTEVELRDNGKKAVVSPVNEYDNRYRYELIVSEQLFSSDGQLLKQAVKLPFAIK
ncbi:hypothetical protein [Salimicrobium halophilum]|uniref:SbsA Ig-like domain-containing protein n=1 Tax=Salimicrobium halophilum TaxID=86666 RepID=A0A1G8S174_9BACI|nr:hypothetical protein [Salimicrobium halophilum]SDJ22967.1 hypothetical protein SAMN04490247_1199 [Salimicrobium halophilum]